MRYRIPGGEAPLFHKYSEQTSAQDAYIEINCESEIVSADWSAVIGRGVPVEVYRNKVLRFSLNPRIKGDALRDLMKDEEFRILCERIVAGYEEEWDGNNNVGTYDEDAQAAIEELEDLLDREFEEAAVWDVEEWLFSNGDIEMHWPKNKSLEDAVADIESEAESEGVVLSGDVEECLLEYALEALNDKEDCIGDVHIEALEENNMIKWKTLTRDAAIQKARKDAGDAYAILLCSNVGDASSDISIIGLDGEISPTQFQNCDEDLAIEWAMKDMVGVIVIRTSYWNGEWEVEVETYENEEEEGNDRSE